jgi:hypothetical protein
MLVPETAEVLRAALGALLSFDESEDEIGSRIIDACLCC